MLLTIDLRQWQTRLVHVINVLFLMLVFKNHLFNCCKPPLHNLVASCIEPRGVYLTSPDTCNLRTTGFEAF